MCGRTRLGIAEPADSEPANSIQVPVQLSDEEAADLAKVHLKKNLANQWKEVFFATYDMLIHSPTSHEELAKINLTELFNKTRSDIYHVHGGKPLEMAGNGVTARRSFEM